MLTITTSTHRARQLLAAFSIILLAAGCQSAYYNAWERLGVHKRDILVDRVEDARDAQQDAQEEFSSALEQLTSLVQSFDGGELERTYRKLQDEYDTSRSAADRVHSRVEAIESVAAALFREWEQEIGEYTNENFQRQSRSKLKQTKTRYSALQTSFERALTSMEPVLATLNDNVLMLKHSLNARAIGALREEYEVLKRDIDRLMREMNASIDRSNAFIAQLQDGDR